MSEEKNPNSPANLNPSLTQATVDAKPVEVKPEPAKEAETKQEQAKKEHISDARKKEEQATREGIARQFFSERLKREQDINTPRYVRADGKLTQAEMEDAKENAAFVSRYPTGLEPGIYEREGVPRSAFIVSFDDKGNTVIRPGYVPTNKKDYVETYKQVVRAYTCGLGQDTLVLDFPNVKDPSHLDPNNILGILQAAKGEGVRIQFSGLVDAKIAEMLGSGGRKAKLARRILNEKNVLEAEHNKSHPELVKRQDAALHQSNKEILEKEVGGLGKALDGLKAVKEDPEKIQASLQEVNAIIKKIDGCLSEINKDFVELAIERKQAASYIDVIEKGRGQLNEAKKLLAADSELAAKVGNGPSSKSVLEAVQKGLNAASVKLEEVSKKAVIEAKAADERMNVKTQGLEKAKEELDKATKVFHKDPKEENAKEIIQKIDALNGNVTSVKKELGKNDVGPGELAKMEKAIARAEVIYGQLPTPAEIAYGTLPVDIQQKLDQQLPEDKQKAHPSEKAQALYQQMDPAKQRDVMGGEVPSNSEAIVPVKLISTQQADVIYSQLTDNHKKEKLSFIGNFIQAQTDAQNNAKATREEAVYLQADQTQKVEQNKVSMQQATTMLTEAVRKLGSANNVAKIIDQVESAIGQIEKITGRVQKETNKDVQNEHGQQHHEILKALPGVLEANEKEMKKMESDYSHAGDTNSAELFQKTAERLRDLAAKANATAEEISKKIAHTASAGPGSPRPPR